MAHLAMGCLSHKLQQFIYSPFIIIVLISSGIFQYNGIGNVNAMVLRRPWTIQQWCKSVKNPRWPFAYQKHQNQVIEWKGRVNSNDQDMRHSCTVFGVESKCFHCEDIACDPSLSSTCSFQIQGTDWTQLPLNIPTVTDVPWAVGGAHRYDYGNTSAHMCLFLSGGDCLTPTATDYSKCVVRCWGNNSGTISYQLDPERGNASVLPRDDADAADIWSYPPTFTSDGKPQGQVTTLAGSGVKGFSDGTSTTAQFNNPQDVAVDSQGFVYVADRDNHRIRRIDPTTNTVTTIAGLGTQGYQDGAALTSATFSYPTGIAVYEDASNNHNVIIFVADTGNHRIRKIMNGIVSCYAGLCGNGVESALQASSPATPHAGLADGDPASARYDTPMGIAVDMSGIVFVADTGNHLIRRIELNGTTNTLAGNVAPAVETLTSGCVSPCLRGVAGTRDGNLTYARFNSPRDVAIGPYLTLLVADGHRIRRVNYDDPVNPTVLEGISSTNRVVTLAGSNKIGSDDGAGEDATFNGPAGVTVSADGRIYAVSPLTCKVRELATASRVARPVSCVTTASQVLLPSGCSSYEPPVDELFRRVSPITNNIFYNFKQREESDPIVGSTIVGRRIKDCTGTPPLDALETGNLSLAWTDAIGNVVADWNEDQEYGTTIKLKCPSGCLGSKNIAPVYGTSMYTDTSSICLAAIHNGVISDSTGGLIELTLERGINARRVEIQTGTVANGVTSLDMDPNPQQAARLFSIVLYPMAQIEVHTVAGAPSALLKSGCGYNDSMPPLAARFNGPHGIEIYSQHSLTRTQQLVIADSNNHRIRQMTATCAKICENGGVCTGPDTCTCTTGWSGDDCSIPLCTAGTCGSRQVCVGPDQCACIPGFTGSPACVTAQCVQTCANGGTCSAPDTCSCLPGWFDSNCTTPVCSQTCGNGGMCTSPNTCTCPTEWKGVDCRVPVCTQTCANGGTCVAPNTCMCGAGWSGHDCSIPICAQGTFVPHPSAYSNALWRPFSFDTYVPCDYLQWCLKTNEFDCLHRLQGPGTGLGGQRSPIIPVPFGPTGRAITGRAVDPLSESFSFLSQGCLLIEVGKSALTPFQYMTELNTTTDFYRYSPKVPYGWKAELGNGPTLVKAPWRGLAGPEPGFLPPFTTTSDRQVALVEKRRVVQGVYACANGGSCTAPDVCTCAPGWIGFDCRTPVCNQGYYVPSQPTYFASDPPESKHPRQPISNPSYTATIETVANGIVTASTVTRGNVQYLPSQGGYACSIRSITKWEKPLTLGPYGSPAVTFNHPNYKSIYMDKTLQLDGRYHTQWTGMYWPPLYALSTPLLDQTRQGWKRGGIWQVVTGNQWQKGQCLLEFQRICTRNGQESILPLVTDTDASYRPQVNYTIFNATRVGYWNVTVTGECVDHVIRGCYNNGTCVAPNTCLCAPGWSGPDCSIPLCTQTCLHSGNCTLPNQCTCEKGWTGHDCSIPLCAQDCRNGGRCVAPDTCECHQYPSTWQDGRGQSVFLTPDGQTQLTGYTGYDCNTPICVQAEKFILNTMRDADGFISLRGHGKDGKLQCTTYRCPQFDNEVVSNDGHSFQSGCSVGNPQPNPIGAIPASKQIEWIGNYTDFLNIKRISDAFLCGNLVWEQGDYTVGRYIRTNYLNMTRSSSSPTGWVYGSSLPGEGIYMCYNKGACIAPDTCSCGDGWAGIDCNRPLCRFLQRNNSVVLGCLNGGICVDKDLCRCIQTDSILYTQFPNAPRGLTGFTGSDCAIPICVQGVWDPLCTGQNGSADGCYRCSNGGMCIAPDVCQCAPGWKGYDCSEPICEIPSANMTTLVRKQLFTVDDTKLIAFQNDPCGTDGGRWGKEMVNGAMIGQGNCTQPKLCTCLCRKPYDPVACKQRGEFCEPPWQDPFHRAIPAGYIYGTKNCADGFQGIEDEHGRFMSCHLQIYVPSLYRRYTVSMVSILSVVSVMVLIAWHYIRKNIRRRLLLAKAERRRSRKNSEQNPGVVKAGAFSHQKQS